MDLLGAFLLITFCLSSTVYAETLQECLPKICKKTDKLEEDNVTMDLVKEFFDFTTCNFKNSEDSVRVIECYDTKLGSPNTCEEVSQKLAAYLKKYPDNECVGPRRRRRGAKENPLS